MTPIVFCEDDPTIQKLIRVALRTTPYDVYVAADGLAGLALIERVQPETVLVVEDDARIRKLVAVTLGRAGYEVTAAANGRQALERVAEATPDLIVSDVMMPEPSATC